MPILLHSFTYTCWFHTGLETINNFFLISVICLALRLKCTLINKWRKEPSTLSFREKQGQTPVQISIHPPACVGEANRKRHLCVHAYTTSHGQHESSQTTMKKNPHHIAWSHLLEAITVQDRHTTHTCRPCMPYDEADAGRFMKPCMPLNPKQLILFRSRVVWGRRERNWNSYSRVSEWYLETCF